MPKLPCLNSGRSMIFWMEAARVEFCWARVALGWIAYRRTKRRGKRITSDRVGTFGRRCAPRNDKLVAVADISLRRLRDSVFSDVQFLKRRVADGVFAPVLVIEMPPFGFVDGEAFGLHGPAKQVAVPALQRSAAGVVGKGARRHFVVGAGHFDGLAGFYVVERQID